MTQERKTGNEFTLTRDPETGIRSREGRDTKEETTRIGEDVKVNWDH